MGLESSSVRESVTGTESLILILKGVDQVMITHERPSGHECSDVCDIFDCSSTLFLLHQ